MTEFKICCDCKQEKPRTAFYPRNERIGDIQARCKECGRKNLKDRNLFNQSYIISILENSECVDCKIRDIRVLQFDHVYDKKLFNISKLIRGHALDKLKLELEKCVIRCANCHQIKTGRTQKDYRFKYYNENH